MNIGLLIVILSILLVYVKHADSYRYEKTTNICDRNKGTNNSVYRLPKTVTPIRYRIRFRSDNSRYKFYGSETVMVMINNRTDTIELNSLDLYIDSASFKTRRLRVEVKNIFVCVERETIILQFYKFLDRGQGNLTINFNGNLNNMVTGFYRTRTSQTLADDGYIAVTDFGPSGSRRAFPNWDEPTFKAMIELTIVSPKHVITLTNMNEEKRRTHMSGMDEIRFYTSPPMTTSLLAIVVGQFDYIEKLTDDNEVLVRVFTPLGRQDEGVFALDITAKLLMYYKYYFNTSYPLTKLDLISITDFPSSMETWGLITFTESQILVNNMTTDADRRTVAAVIAHALAHQWFGNLVTLDMSNELWISEGFATFIENEAIDILYPNWKTWHTFAAKELQNALELDALNNSVAIDTKITAATVDHQFSALPYQKSAAIIKMVSGFVGKQSFRDGMRKFLSTHSYKTVSSTDLWQTFEEIKEIKLKEITESWAKQKGYPVIDVKEEHQRDERTLTLTQERFAPLDKSNKSDQLWQIPVRITNMYNPFVPSVETAMRNKQINLTMKGIFEGEWIKLNHMYEGFYRVNYPIEMLQKFANSIEDKSMPAMDRLNIITDLFAMIQSGRTPTHTGLMYLLHYKNDDNSAIWDYMLKLLFKLDLLFSDTDIREQFWLFGRQLLSGIHTKFGWDPKDNEDLRLTKLRPQILTLLATFKDKKVISEGLKRYEDYKKDNLNTTDNNIILVIYKIVGGNSDDTVLDEFFELYKTSENPIKRNHIITALTATDKKERILKVLDFSLSETIRFIDSSKIISGLCHSWIGRDKTWKFFEKNFDEFVRMFGSSTVEINILVKNFIEMFSSEDKVNEFELFFGQRSRGGIDKTIETSLEKIRLNAKWLNRDILQIREFLNQYSNSSEAKNI